MHRDESYLLEALKNGAAAYILKDSSVEELVKAAVEAVAGRRYLSSPLSQSAIDAYVQRASAATLDRYDSLRSREREVLQLAAEGHTNAEIGKRLFISPRTVLESELFSWLKAQPFVGRPNSCKVGNPLTRQEGSLTSLEH
jgi:two-component system, NarL family, response regulator NreC